MLHAWLGRLGFIFILFNMIVWALGLAVAMPAPKQKGQGGGRQGWHRRCVVEGASDLSPCTLPIAAKPNPDLQVVGLY